MSTRPTSPTKDLTPEHTSAILQRILDDIENEKRNHWVQLTCAIVLSLATTCSAWCAYQSTRWSGVQTFRLAAANQANRASNAAVLSAMQARYFDATMGISWMQAKHDGNERQEKFLFDRFRPEMKSAVDAWLKTDPFNNPDAPRGPLQMPEYEQQGLTDAKQQDEVFEQKFAGAMQANQTSDTYVLLTVLFASVLFFAGIAGNLDSRRLRLSILAVALVLFIVTIAYLARMPICRE